MSLAKKPIQEEEVSCVTTSLTAVMADERAVAAEGSAIVAFRLCESVVLFSESMSSCRAHPPAPQWGDGITFA